MVANNILEFISSETNFIKVIEDQVRISNGEYIDCIVHFCQKRNIEVEQIVPLIKNNPLFKSAFQKEAERLNFIKKKKGKKK